MVISFAGVEIATPSFLDEVVLRLGAILQASPETVALMAEMNEDVHESLDLVLERRGLVLGAIEEGQVRLLGGNQQLAKTLEEARRLGTFRASELADRLGVKLPNMHQRLKTLVEAGVISRELDQTAERGRRYDFTAPDPKQFGVRPPSKRLVVSGK